MYYTAGLHGLIAQLSTLVLSETKCHLMIPKKKNNYSLHMPQNWCVFLINRSLSWIFETADTVNHT